MRLAVTYYVKVLLSLLLFAESNALEVTGEKKPNSKVPGAVSAVGEVSSIASSPQPTKQIPNPSKVSAETRETSTQKYNARNQIVKPTSSPPNDLSLYRLNSEEDGTTCILMTVDAMISFIYTTKYHQVEEGDTFVPNNVESITGDCSKGDKSVMVLKWKSFDLSFDFAKTPGGERWFVNRVQLNFNSEAIFKRWEHPNTRIEAKSSEGKIFFPTPVGRSFKCLRELEINLFDSRYPDIKVKLLLRKLTVEPFIFKNDGFGPEYLCSAFGAGSFRGETAPFIFGSLLTIASLFTIAGYAVYRYLKVNKVQYDTME